MKIHVLPTDKPSRLIIYSTLLNEFRLLDEPIDDWKHKRNIYITDDEYIKRGDWYIADNKVYQAIADHNNPLTKDSCRKIILTTDLDLIAEGIQSIDDTFLEWFVENPSCVFVEIKDISIEDIIEEWWEDLTNAELIEVYKKTGNFRLGGWLHDIGPTEEDVKDMYLEIHNLNSKQLKANYYKIIIPQEPKQLPKSEIDWSGFPKSTKDKVGYKEPKQGTVEEAAKYQADRMISEEAYEDALNMQKASNAGYESKIAELEAQIKEMYSKDEVLKILLARNVELGIIDKTSEVEEWFNRFKKK